jgi:uncharacterized membrane protein
MSFVQALADTGILVACVAASLAYLLGWVAAVAAAVTGVQIIVNDARVVAGVSRLLVAGTLLYFLVAIFIWLHSQKPPAG